jgi:hypothetical protein
MQWFVLQRDQTVPEIKRPCVVVLGEHVHSKNADLLGDVAGRLQKMQEKQFTEALFLASYIDGKPPEMGCGQGCLGSPAWSSGGRWSRKNVPADAA